MSELEETPNHLWMSKLRTGRVVCQGGCAAKWSEKDSELVKSTDTGTTSCRSEPNDLTSLGLPWWPYFLKNNTICKRRLQTKCLMKSTRQSWFWASFEFWHLPLLTCTWSYHMCSNAWLLWASEQKALFPQFSSQPLKTTRPRPWSYCQHPPSLHWKYGKHMVRQELQELREKQNLADVLVPVAVSQGSLWPSRTWRNGKHLKGVTCFLSGGRVFLTMAKVIYLSTKGWDFLI